jgi:hypothetical protein
MLSGNATVSSMNHSVRIYCPLSIGTGFTTCFDPFVSSWETDIVYFSFNSLSVCASTSIDMFDFGRSMFYLWNCNNITSKMKLRLKLNLHIKIKLEQEQCFIFSVECFKLNFKVLRLVIKLLFPLWLCNFIVVYFEPCGPSQVSTTFPLLDIPRLPLRFRACGLFISHVLTVLDYFVFCNLLYCYALWFPSHCSCARVAVRSDYSTCVTPALTLK